MLFSINCFNFNSKIKNNKEVYKMLVTTYCPELESSKIT